MGVLMHMRERTVSPRKNDISPVSTDARHIFPRILATATMALTFGFALGGCHGSSTQNGSNAPSGDPSDVNAATTQSTCPTGQMLMSDGSCAVPSQVASAPAAATPTAPSARSVAATPRYAPQ